MVLSFQMAYRCILDQNIRSNHLVIIKHMEWDYIQELYYHRCSFKLE